MKSIILSFIQNQKVANILIDIFLKLDNYLYKIITILSVAAENGAHPKHNILRYYEWFANEIDDNATVLDIGCNTGNLLKKLSPKIKKGYGIDIIEKHIKTANQINDEANLEYIYADATTYDFNKFEGLNVITLSNVLEHIDQRVYFLKQIINSLKGKKCSILIRVPLITRDWVSCYKRNRGVEFRLDQTHYIEYTESEILNEVKEAGIKVNKTEIRFGEIFLNCEVN